MRAPNSHPFLCGVAPGGFVTSSPMRDVEFGAGITSLESADEDDVGANHAVVQIRTDSRIPQSGEEPPWEGLLRDLSLFVTRVDSLRDMAATVLPVLRKKDEERALRISQIAGPAVKGVEERVLELKIKSLPVLRELLGHIKKLSLAESAFRRSIVVSGVSCYDELVKKTLEFAFTLNSGWLSGKSKGVQYSELMAAGSLEELKRTLLEREVDELMRGSRNAQLLFLDGKLKLGLEERFAGFGPLMELSERRNLFVHADGVVGSAYLDTCRRWGIAPGKNLDKGAILGADDEYLASAFACLVEAGVWLVHAGVRRLHDDIPEGDDLGLTELIYDCLRAEDWRLAIRVSEFALNLPDKYRITGDSRYAILINKCIAKKSVGDDFSGDLSGVEWSTLHPLYGLAKAALEDDFLAVRTLLCTDPVKERVSVDSILEWPLFSTLREHSDFPGIFEDAFGVSLDEVVSTRNGDLVDPPDQVPCMAR